eukprot:GDKI01040646.1.p2 GENE.GDKI01040646.1~~GDKI01040646.1.p2  ORF type:complete len:240 (-),score=76.63 GDKI01040646.1:321-1040(-)
MSDLKKPLKPNSMDLEGAPMMGEYLETREGWHPDLFSWRFAHVLGFLTGGTTFIAGTVCLFYPGWDFVSAFLYTLGSCGFLFVDVQEFFTFEGLELRTNIALSAIGSTFYVIGSVGFFPAIFAWDMRMGVWGFILGSFFIGVSQLWKTHRIGATESTDHVFHLSTLLFVKDAFTAAGVEFGACCGAWCFFFGTIMFNLGPLEGPNSVLNEVLWVWVAGSCFFTVGGLFLGYRHFVMDVV